MKSLYSLCSIILLVISSCSNPETYRGAWMIEVDKKPLLLTYTHYYRGGKSSSEYDYFRVIDPATGHIQGEAEYNVRRHDINNKFMTASSLFVEINHEWECRNLKNMSLRWDHEGLMEKVKKENKSIQKIHETSYYRDSFTITNTVGQSFRFSRKQLEGTHDTASTLLPLVDNPSYYSIDRYSYLHRTDIDTVAKQKMVKIFGDYTKKIGFSLNGHILALEGEKRKTLQRLDTSSYEWKNCFEDKIWLNGDFLLPYKQYRDYSSAGLIVSWEQSIFIFYHTSLEKEDDSPRLACLNMTDKKITWDIPLEKLELENDYYPKSAFISGNNLLVIWIGEENNYLITALSIDKGKMKWSLTK